MTDWTWVTSCQEEEDLGLHTDPGENRGFLQYELEELTEVVQGAACN